MFGFSPPKGNPVKLLLFRVPFVLSLCGLAALPGLARSEPPPASPLVLTISMSRYRKAEKPAVSPLGDPMPLERVDAPVGKDGRIAVMTGEPLILNARLTNAGAETVTLNLGNDLHPWLKLTVTGPEGNALRPIPYHRNAYASDGAAAFALSGKRHVSLKPGEHHDEQFVVTQQFSLGSAGKYRLSARMTVPYYDGALDFLGVYRAQPTGTASSTEALSLAASLAGLRPQETLAQLLLKQAEAETVYVENTLVVQALFSMSESSAFPAWEKACLSRKTDSQTIMIELERLSTPTAAALLGRIAADADRDVLARHVALSKLSSMYRARDEIGNPALEPVAGNLLKQLEGTLPPLVMPTPPPDR